MVYQHKSNEDYNMKKLKKIKEINFVKKPAEVFNELMATYLSREEVQLDKYFSEHMIDDDENIDLIMTTLDNMEGYENVNGRKCECCDHYNLTIAVKAAKGFNVYVIVFELVQNTWKICLMEVGASRDTGDGTRYSMMDIFGFDPKSEEYSIAELPTDCFKSHL